MTVQEAPFYVTGGPLRLDAPSYVERRADRELLAALRSGEFCYVLTPRQMGKSSLMVRTAARLRQQGTAAVVLDLTAIGQNVTPEQWYEGLLGGLGRQLGLEEELETYWLEHPRVSPVQRWMSALVEVVLPHVRGRAPGGIRNSGQWDEPTRESDTALVVFIDEIDFVRSLPFPTDEFFAAIRGCYNRRAAEPGLTDLTFCLLGVAQPSDLIQDPRSTPFNIGQRIDLEDFRPEEAAVMTAGLPVGSRRENLVRRVLYWTGGHPYLTQRLCRTLSDEQQAGREAPDPADVDRVCAALFTSPRAHRWDDNLAFVRDRLLRASPDVAGVLELYRRVRQSGLPFFRAGKVRDDPGEPQQGALRLSGIVRARDRRLEVRNRIYARVFDRHWIRHALPGAEVRRQRAAFFRGFARATMLAVAVVAIVAWLAGIAVHNEHLAKRNAHKANGLAASLRSELLHEDGLLNRLREALGQVRLKSNLAQQEAARALAAQGGEHRQRLLSDSARRQAQASRREALRQRGVAVTQRERNRQQLAATQVANGARLVDAGDYLGALPWYAAALHLDAGHPEAERADRLRIGCLLKVCPHLVHVAGAGARLSTAELSPDGRWAAVVLPNGASQTWNVETGAIHPLANTEKDAPGRPIFSADCRLVLLVGRGGVARVFDSATGSPRGGPLAFYGPGSCGAISPDGRRIAVGTATGDLQEWEALTGVRIGPVVNAGYDVGTVAYSKDGDRLITSSGLAVQVWDSHSLKPVLPPLRFRQAVYSAFFSPDGRRLVTAGRDGIRGWDAFTGLPMGLPYDVSGSSRTAEYSADGRRVLSTDGIGNTRVWETATGREMGAARQHADSVQEAGFTDGGRRVVTASSDRTARVWDAERGDAICPPLRHSAAVLAAVPRGDGRRVVTISADGLLREWELAAQDYPGSAPIPVGPDRLTHVVYSDDGTLVATWDPLIVWSARTGAVLTTPSNPGEVRGIAFSRDHRLLATWGTDGARVWDTHTGKPVIPRLPRKGILAASFSPDGRWVLTRDSGEGSGAEVWEVGTGRPVSPRFTGMTLRDEMFSPDGKALLLIRNSPMGSEISVRDVLTGRRRGPGVRSPLRFRCGAFRPDGRAFAAGAETGEVREWELSHGGLLPVRAQHRLAVNTVRFSSDGNRLVTAGDDHTARVWDAVTGRALAPPLPHQAAVVDAQFSPDGRLVVTACPASGCRVWDAATGWPVTPPIHHPGDARRAWFSRDGLRFFADGQSEVAESGELASDPRPEEQISRLAELLSGERKQESGQPEPVSPSDLRRLWQDAARARGPEALPNRDWPAIRGWHAREAQGCEEAGAWASAETHLDVLVRDHPSDWGLHSRRARARAEQGHWSEALTDYRAALRFGLPVGADARLLSWRASLCALAAGDQASYRDVCRSGLARCGAAPPDALADMVTFSCSLGPGAADETALRLSRRLVERNPGNLGYRETLGALLYRAGQNEEALHTLTASLLPGEDKSDLPTWLVMVLVQARLGHAAEARSLLERCERTAPTLLAAPDGPDNPLTWDDRIEIRLGLKEASSAVQQLPPPRR